MDINMILPEETIGEREEDAMSFEISVLDFIQAHLRCNFWDAVMPFITRLGDGRALWGAVAVLPCIFSKTRRIGMMMIVSLALEVVCYNMILKPLVARVRPCDVNAQFALLIPNPSDYSFPSGHTGASFAAVSALYFGKSRLWRPFGVIAVLIAFSRLYLYVHYPSDVLAGMLLGIVLGWASSRAVRQFSRRKCLNG